MLDILLYGFFAADWLHTVEISNVPLLELFRTSLAVNAGILGALLVTLVPQDRVRPALTALALVCLAFFAGLVFTTLLIAAVVVVFLAARRLQRWSQQTGNAKRPLLVGWLIVHAMYLPAFVVILPPFRGQMVWGELALFWGLAYATLKSINYIHVACSGGTDPFERGAFQRFLLYMIHFASFWHGPYQEFNRFDREVSTCKDRLTWRNRLRGLFRIGVGLVKFLIIFHVINKEFFYPNGYTGPFAEELFQRAPLADPGHLWLMTYLLAARIYLFLSGINDGVIGMNMLMGIRMRENMDWPVLSRDVMEFWRRWNIQVTMFLRNEVFFPVGGLRHRVLGYFCIFAYSGLWHYPSLFSIIAFPALQMVTIEATIRYAKFWKRHKKNRDWIYIAGKRLHIHDSLLSRLLGMVFVWHVMAVSVMFIHDHHYGGMTMLPRMLGF